jgi:hypothetical protein
MSTQPYGAGGCTSFQNDIRPKFTAEDVDHMNDFGIDLSDYATVRDNADLILTRLQDTGNPMPPVPRGPWPPAWIECFQQWIDGGKQP